VDQTLQRPANGIDVAHAVAVDCSGNVFVTGESWGGINYDYATIKYSASGVELWTRRYNEPGYNRAIAYALTVDGSGNVFVAGNVIGDTGDAWITIKYSSGGALLWTNRFRDGGNRPAITADSSGNVFVAATSPYPDLFPWTNFCETVMAYSAVGLPLWTNYYGQPWGAGASAVAVDASGNVIVTGSATIKYSAQTTVTSLPLHIQRLGNAVLLSWTNAAFGLQSAPIITGNFTNISGAISPFTNPISGPQQYFRLKVN